MKELSLFSGAGGGLLASKYLLGWRTLGYVEFNDYCQRVIAQRIKDGLLDEAPIFCDIRAFINDGYAESYNGMVDVVSGGFPCQDISAAGKGRGIDGPRSSLWFKMATVIDKVRPEFVFVENTPMLISRGLTRVLDTLTSMGYDSKWGCVSGYQAGGETNGERLWLVAKTDVYRSQILCADKKTDDYQEKPKKNPYELDATINRIKRLEQSLGECALRGTPYYVADKLDRFKAIGNGQDPKVAATAWRILTEDFS